MTENQYQPPTREQIAAMWDQARDDMSIPRDRDGGLVPVNAFEAGVAAALALVQQPAPSVEFEPTREQIESAVGAVLFNASNYPRPAVPHILGQDIAPLRSKVTDAALALFQQPTPSAEPVSIADMTPGTTFVEEVRWTVTGTLSTGSTVAHSGSGEMRFADRFDPSTIRDVTLPPATPEADR